MSATCPYHHHGLAWRKTLNKDSVAYHYTDLSCLVFILTDGYIRPSRHIRAGAGGGPDIGQGLVWFTLRLRIDPSATAAMASLPRFRLAVPAAATLAWSAGCKLDRWASFDMDLAARAARATPATIAAWRVIQGQVPLTQVSRIDVERPGGVWREPPVLPAVDRDGNQAMAVFEGETFAIKKEYRPQVREFAYSYQRGRCAT
jgi:hypothetical protein